jgi:glutamine cyclotransferase
VLNNLGHSFFGEGLTILKNQIYQLSWQEHQAFVYDLNGKLIRRMENPREGWGLTNDGKRLIMSDGTRTIYFRSPKTLQVSRTVLVTGGPPANPEMRLNELEYVRGEIYANVWPTNYLVMINPDSGKVTGWVDLSAIVPQGPANLAELNGIAYDARQGRLFITGKFWPTVFEIKLTPKN